MLCRTHNIFLLFTCILNRGEGASQFNLLKMPWFIGTYLYWRRSWQQHVPTGEGLSEKHSNWAWIWVSFLCLSFSLTRIGCNASQLQYQISTMNSHFVRLFCQVLLFLLVSGSSSDKERKSRLLLCLCIY